MGGNGIVGGQIPTATGFGFAIKYRGGDLGIELKQSYGLTEAAPVLAMGDVKGAQAVPGVEVEIRDVNEDGVGEIVAFVSQVHTIDAKCDALAVTREQVEASITRCPDPAAAEEARRRLAGERRVSIVDSAQTALDGADGARVGLGGSWCGLRGQSRR